MRPNPPGTCALTSAPQFSSVRAISTSPARAASISGVVSAKSPLRDAGRIAFTSARWSSSLFTALTLPARMALSSFPVAAAVPPPLSNFM
jgi:hypothetical protein